MSWLQPSVLKKRLRSRVIVTLHSGESFSGVLWECDDRAWVLRSASAFGVKDGEVATPVDGEVVILSENVAFAQRP